MYYESLNSDDELSQIILCILCLLTASEEYDCEVSCMIIFRILLTSLA